MNRCRFCVLQTPVFYSLVDERITPMFEFVTGCKLTADPLDPISKVICPRCFATLKLSFNFLKRLKMSEEKLEKLSTIKPEPIQRQVPKENVRICYGKCLVCGSKTDPQNKHIKTHFTQELKCYTCNLNFENVETYCRHLATHPKLLYECNSCKAKFRYKNLFDLHVNKVCCKALILQSLRSKKALAALQPKSTTLSKRTNGSTLKEDVKGSVVQKLKRKKYRKENIGKFVCKICCKSFTAKTFPLHTHETTNCTICKRKVPSTIYERHLNDHKGEPHVCHICGAHLLNLRSFRCHMFYSHNEKRYKCEHCNKAFLHKNHRAMHIQKDHIGKPSCICDTCGKIFFNKQCLQSHIKNIHLQVKPHSCEHCSKAFYTRDQLKTHLRQHTKETPYKCVLCGQEFRQRVSLRTHSKSKHGIIEKIICHCKICGKGFASDQALTSHRQRVH